MLCSFRTENVLKDACDIDTSLLLARLAGEVLV
jgi:hypothetical protein